MYINKNSIRLYIIVFIQIRYRCNTLEYIILNLIHLYMFMYSCN